MADIVREAGVAQGTFYLYFPSKKDAFFALAQQLPQMMTAAVMGAYDPALSFEERVRAMTHAGLECCRGNADLVRLINFGADSISIEVQGEVLRTHPMVNALADIFRRDISEGTIEPVDPVMTARLIMGMYKNAFIEAIVLGSGQESAQVEEALSGLVIRALKNRK